VMQRYIISNLSLSLSLSVYIFIHIYLSIYPYIYLHIYIYLSVYISIYLSIYLFISLSLSLSLFSFISRFFFSPIPHRSDHPIDDCSHHVPYHISISNGILYIYIHVSLISSIEFATNTSIEIWIRRVFTCN